MDDMNTNPDGHDIATLAYAAGLFDGEGSVSIVHVRGAAEKKYHQLNVNLANTDPRPLIWLRDHFGGSVRPVKPHPDGRRKPQWRWQVNATVADRFFRAIRPYLIIKAEQVDIAIAFRETVKGRIGRQRGASEADGTGLAAVPITPEIEQQRAELRSRLLLLNKRGA